MTVEDTTRSIEGDVVSIQFKNDRNGKEFVTVSLQQDGLTYPTNVRSRDGEILQRMVNANKHIQSGKVVRLGVDVKESPRSEGGYYRDIIRITNASLDDVSQEPTPNGSPQSARPAYNPSNTPISWGSLDERIAWNSSINNSVTALGPLGKLDADSLDVWVTAMEKLSNIIYPIIRNGPLPDAPERPQEAPADAPSSSAGPSGEEGQHPADSDDGVEV